VQLDVYDLRGSRVRSVFREELAAGNHTIQWNGRDNNDQLLASGTYFATLNVRGPGLAHQLSRKVNLLR
jgi:flagellar hook assembly protein FlgD